MVNDFMDSLKETLQKGGFREGEDYKCYTYPERQYQDRYVMTDVATNPKLDVNRYFKMRDILHKFEKKNKNVHFNPKEGNNLFGVSLKIDKEVYNNLAECEDLNAAVNPIYGNWGDTTRNESSETHGNNKEELNSESQSNKSGKKSQNESQSAASKEEAQTTQEQSSPEEEAVILEPSEKSACVETTSRKQTVVESLRETASDSQVQKQSLCVAAAVTIAAGLFIAVKELHNAPRLEGESGTSKAKRVLSQTFKRSSTYKKMLVAGFCGGLAWFGYHAGKKMSNSNP